MAVMQHLDDSLVIAFRQQREKQKAFLLSILLHLERGKGLTDHALALVSEIRRDSRLKEEIDCLIVDLSRISDSGLVAIPEEWAVRIREYLEIQS